MKILQVAAEMYPLIKTGGLADVVGALPFSQQQLGQDVRVLLPAYPALTQAFPAAGLVGHYDSFAGRITLHHAEYRGIGIYLLDAPHLFAREGNPYHDDHYHDYSDNYLRFALLGFVGAGLASGWDKYWQPDVLHAHDWHAGLACAYLKHWKNAIKTVFTIHNIAYQGLYATHHLPEIELPSDYLHVEGLEFHGQLSYLKAGIYFADEVTTVSPTFAKEITHESHGFGLHGLLQTRQRQGHLHGVLNGIDESVWHPAQDPLIEKSYKIGAMTGKAANKVALQKHFDLPASNAPVFIMVSRLTEQKGVDLFIESISTIIKKKGQVIVLGSGAPEFETALLALHKQHPKQVGVIIGYNENLSHLMLAGGDVIVIPSRFEPCGLTQLYGLKYGTLPLVRHTGGLADTVVHMDNDTFKSRQATGFVFDAMTATALLTAINQVFDLWKTPRKWSSVRANAMRQNFTWQQSAARYLDLYRTKDQIKTR